MANSHRASRRSKHVVSWKDLLVARFRKAPPDQDNITLSSASSIGTSPTPTLSAIQAPRTLVRSNARAKSPKDLQAQKTGRTNGRSRNSREYKRGHPGSKISLPELGGTPTYPDTEACLPSPPPYVLSLPEAVMTPPSLVALTDDELRSRGIYSPHPGMELGTIRALSGMSRSSMSRTTSLRSALSMFAPRLGLRPAASSGNLLSRSEDHARDQSSPLASTLLVIGVCVSVLMTSLDRGSITTAIPSILADFGSYQGMGWYGSAYLLTVSAFQPMYGRIYTSFNIKSSFLVAVAIFELGALICATASVPEAFILGRAMQGLGNAGISTGFFAIATHNFNPEARPALLACLDVLSWIGAIAAPVLGAMLSQHLSWEWCYYLNLMLGGTTFTLVLLFSSSHQPRTPRPNLIRQASDFSSTGKSFARRVLALDWVGSLLFIAACTFLFLALQLSQQKGFGWSSPLWAVFTSLSVTTILLCLLWMHIRGDNALIPFHILRQRTVAASCGSAFFLYGAFTIHAYYLPIWFRAMKDDSAIDSGIAMIPYMLSMALLSLVAGRYVFGNRYFALVTTIACAVATVGSGLITMLGSEASILTCAGFQMITAAGLGIAMQKGLSAVQAVLPAHEISIGTAAVVAYQNAGGAVFVSVGDTLFQKYLFPNDNGSGLDFQDIMKLGMTESATLVSDQAPDAIPELYGDAFRAVSIAVVPLCGLALLFSMCMEWKITNDDQVIRTPGMMNMRAVNGDLSSPELGSDAPTLAHLAPRARHRWSQRWSVPIADIEVGRTRLNTVLQELNDSKSSLLSLEDTTVAEIKEMDIGRAI